MRNTQFLDRGKPEHGVNASKSRWYAPSPEEPDEGDHPLRLFLTIWNTTFLSRYGLGDGIRYVVLRKFGSGSTGNFANAEQDLTFSSTISLNAKPDVMKFTPGSESAFERVVILFNVKCRCRDHYTIGSDWRQGEFRWAGARRLCAMHCWWWWCYTTNMRGTYTVKRRQYLTNIIFRLLPPNIHTWFVVCQVEMNGRQIEHAA